MKVSPVPVIFIASISLSLPACHKSEARPHEEHHHTIVATSPLEKDVISTQEYVCQIHSRRHIEVRALKEGYLEEILVKEGQEVKQGDLLFKILPVLYQAKLDADLAEAQLAQIELKNTKELFQKNVVSQTQVALDQAKLAKAQANVELSQAELNFTTINAPFDGIIDRFHERNGSLVEEGDILTTLSDNDVMWVYFNVPEARYLEYMAGLEQVETGEEPDDEDEKLRIELVLANGKKFQQPGEITAIEADFNNETGNIAFRADFPNPEGLLRHGQTGTVLIHRVMDDALVIPQRATFEILAKQYVFVLDEQGVVHQREITVQSEKEDIFVIDSGLDDDEMIVLDGVRQVSDGEKVEFEFLEPEEVLADQKYHAE